MITITDTIAMAGAATMATSSSAYGTAIAAAALPFATAISSQVDAKFRFERNSLTLSDFVLKFAYPTPIGGHQNG
jgi:hypothetical protein